MKKCCRCHEHKPLTEFYVNNQAKDKHDYMCKKCKDAENLAYQAEVKQDIAEEQSKQYRKATQCTDGYKITILNYAKQGEYLYQIYGNGESLETNDRDLFLEHMYKLLLTIKQINLI